MKDWTKEIRKNDPYGLSDRVIALTEEGSTGKFLESFPSSVQRSLYHRLVKTEEINRDTVAFVESLFRTRILEPKPALSFIRSFTTTYTSKAVLDALQSHSEAFLREYGILFEALYDDYAREIQQGLPPKYSDSLRKTVLKNEFDPEILSEACGIGYTCWDNDNIYAHQVFYSLWKAGVVEISNKYIITQQAAEAVFMAMSVPECAYINNMCSRDRAGAQLMFGLKPAQIPGVAQVMEKERDTANLILKPYNLTMSKLEDNLAKALTNDNFNVRKDIGMVMFPLAFCSNG